MATNIVESIEELMKYIKAPVKFHIKPQKGELYKIWFYKKNNT